MAQLRGQAFRRDLKRRRRAAAEDRLYEAMVEAFFLPTARTSVRGGAGANAPGADDAGFDYDAFEAEAERRYYGDMHDYYSAHVAPRPPPPLATDEAPS